MSSFRVKREKHSPDEHGSRSRHRSRSRSRERIRIKQEVIMLEMPQKTLVCPMGAEFCSHALFVELQLHLAIIIQIFTAHEGNGAK